MSQVVAIGIDAGSTTCKLVAVDHDGAIVGSLLEPTEPRVEVQVQRMIDALHSELCVDGDVPAIATGYGRKLIKDATRNVTEITCHASFAISGARARWSTSAGRTARSSGLATTDGRSTS
ncbi:MAG: hypothetical protein EP303_02750 [Deltaproteobacteria bacterium]|nr:MAG: hypothetical protein EP303_02750 [Deltaproteobacteria bacterium]